MDELRAFLNDQINGGFGVRELSRQTGVSASTISRVCSGQVAPDIETANKILHPFGYRLAINKIGMEPIVHSPKPEALTLEQLREMMKEPLKHWVWIENLTSPEGSGYMRNHGDWSNGRYFCCGWPGTGYSFVYELYGKSWLAYATKPETEGD